jgi:hypothetical protein
MFRCSYSWVNTVWMPPTVDPEENRIVVIKYKDKSGILRDSKGVKSNGKWNVNAINVLAWRNLRLDELKIN